MNDYPEQMPIESYEDTEKDNLSESPKMNVMDLANTAMNLYAQCRQVEEQTEQMRIWSKVKITETIAKYKTCQELLYYTFSERHDALSKHYEILNTAISEGDNNLVIAALQGISSIVTSSPLSDFKKFVELYSDTSKPLLDF